MVRASGRLHNRALDGIMKAPMKFFDANPPGRILNRFSRDLDEGMSISDYKIFVNFKSLINVVIFFLCAVSKSI